VALRLASVLVRNLVPVAGVLALGWSAPHLLVAYFADTVLGMAAAIALVFSWMSPPGGREGERVYYATDLLSHYATAVAVAAVIAIPLGGPVVFLLARGGFDVREALGDAPFRNALLVQAATALLLSVRDLQAQAGLPLEALGLRDRFGLFFVRWFALCALALSPIGVFLGRAAGPLLVALYAGLTICGELAPRRLLATFDRDARG
jgi:hypothetical protein